MRPRGGLIGGCAVHPRLAEQGLDGEALARALAAALPPLVPFRAPRYEAVRAVLDWDHRLPSQAVRARLLAYHSAAAREAGERDLDRRRALIRDRDRFPEFDVPDFEGVACDEAYEAELSLAGAVDSWRLTSPWRREIDERDARKAVAVVRLSRQFVRTRDELPGRPPFLGDLQAMQWLPPLESGQPRWAVDVWFLVGLRGAEAQARSFLADVDEGTVLAVRDVTARVR